MKPAWMVLLLLSTFAVGFATHALGPTPAYADRQWDAGVAPAPAPDPAAPSLAAPRNTEQDVGGLVDAVKGGKWLLAIGFAISLLTAAAKLLLPKLKDDRLGAIAVFVVGFLGVLSAAIIAGVPIGLNVILGALSATFTAAGGYAWIKRILWPDRTTS